MSTGAAARRTTCSSEGAAGTTRPDTPQEGRALLDHLLRHASSPDYTIRFGWQPGDFVLWDNQATWHYAVDDYGDGARVYRKVIGVEPLRRVLPGQRE
ncbi:TauD/TfdA dioxygenase family protein [Streptomyces sp. NPDC002306]